MSPSPTDRSEELDQPESTPHVPVIRHGRYRLDDFISADFDRESWRAYDLVLNRVVGIQFVSRQHPRFEAIYEAARRAGAVVDRRVVRVIDVVRDDVDLCIVSEWVDGLPLDEFIHTQLNPQHSVTLTQNVVEAIYALGRPQGGKYSKPHQGWTHGRITPKSVIVNPNGEVRLLGHQVQAAMHGTVHGAPQQAEDIASVGAVLQACLTETWPAPVRSQLAESPKSGSDYALPGQLRAWLPKSIDEFVNRTRIGPNQHQDINDLRLGLLALKQELPEDKDDTLAHVEHHAPNRANWLRLGMVAAASVVVLGVVGFGTTAMIQNDGSRELTSADGAIEGTDDFGQSPQQLTDSNPNLVNVGPSPADDERELPIVAAWGVGEEPKRLTSSATGQHVHDGDITTGWRTSEYDQPDVTESEADGLLIDLGSKQQISAFDLDLIGSNSDFVITTGAKSKLLAGKGKVFSKIGSAPSRLISRAARPANTRYALISFTKVPLGSDGYQGGILSMKVIGP